jgi:hypothetical protein
VVNYGAYTWPIVATACCAVAGVGIRCVILYLGLRIALRDVTGTDRFRIYREFAHAISAAIHPGGLWPWSWPRRGCPEKDPPGHGPRH